MNSIKITVLAENTAGGRGLLAEHGLSLLLEVNRTRVLFDTGQGLVLAHNAAQLGLRLDSIDCIALSHGHYDHTGGLSDVLAVADHPRVYFHPQALAPKYSCNKEGYAREIGISESNLNRLQAKGDLKWVLAPTEIGDGLWITGPIPRITDFEDTGGAFFKDKACREADDLPDDQAAFVETDSGTVVILGCAHSGVINTLRLVRSLTADRHIHAIIGGMHLLNAGPDRMSKTIEELLFLDVDRLFPCHCTGFAAIARLWNAFPGRCETCPVGTSICLEE